MKITRCAGAETHFFDGDKYSACPVCGAAAASATAAPAAAPEKRAERTGAGNSVNNTQQDKQGGKKPWWKSGKRTADEPVKPASDLTVQMDEPEEIPVVPKTTTFQEEVLPLPEVHETPDPKVSTISGHIPQAPEGPTPEERRRKYDSDKTIGIYSQDSNEPVVGWLVCIKGESLGESFNLKAGKNSIGRGAGMDVMLAKERTVSRDKHAIITYEPKNRIFLLQPGDGSGLVYLNDNLLMSYSEIKLGDSIQIGEAIFKFVPMCGPDFTWDDYINE